MGDGKRQKTRNGAFGASVEVKPRGNAQMVDSPIARHQPKSPMFNTQTMEVILERSNLLNALKKVQKNKGAPGVDEMTTEELPQFLKENWKSVKVKLLKGEYFPRPVRRVEIPKPGKKNEARKLGIPCVIDRLIQQAILQVLEKRWDPSFSDYSFGFRPGRSAHQAVAKAQTYLREGF